MAALNGPTPGPRGAMRITVFERVTGAPLSQARTIEAGLTPAAMAACRPGVLPALRHEALNADAQAEEDTDGQSAGLTLPARPKAPRRNPSTRGACGHASRALHARFTSARDRSGRAHPRLLAGAHHQVDPPASISERTRRAFPIRRPAAADAGVGGRLSAAAHATGLHRADLVWVGRRGGRVRRGAGPVRDRRPRPRGPPHSTSV